ncbi:MAG: DUF3131 domain-containing protein [Clostridia bacterium]|nr:DUF3131 domain-containing protein [Clostridia bacterium]
MKSFERYSGKKGDALEKRMRRIAEMPEGGRRRLALPAGVRLALRRNLALAEELGRAGLEDENIERLRGDSRRIEAWLRAAACREVFPALKREARLLAIARELVSGGGESLDKEKLLGALSAFEGVRPLRMRELQSLPDALRIAFCEAMAELSGDILRHARARKRAGEWLERGGRLPGRVDAAFLEHGLRLSAENEDFAAHEKLLEHCREERIVEEASRADADCALRYGNLMRLYYLLEAVDWQACFEEISSVEAELREDAAYAGMDEASRAQVRAAVAELADSLGLREAAVVRCALRLAAEQEKEVCHFLVDDGGRDELRRSTGARGRLNRRVPDPSSRLSTALLGSLTALMLVLCCWAVGTPLLWIHCVPLAWIFATKVIGRFYSRWVKPRTLLKMDVERVPDDARTLVVLPVLLSSAARAREMAAHMEGLGCLERDENIDFLLLGDFKDSDTAEQEGDGEILEAARDGVAALNRRAGREKYFYLHRERRLRELDGKWMGEGRKRGALTALNRLILNRDGAAEAFGAEKGAAEKIAGRYKYVVTLDADTEYLPGTLQKLIGAMLHPQNRGYALLQPCMQMTAEANVNAYVKLNCGMGGVDSYPVNVSDFYQDMTGRGNFSGKGIYDVAAFAAATDGALPDDEILSHDLIEGILAGAGFVGDVCFYDGVPDNVNTELNRLHRWTRGDWQLLRVLFSKRKIAAVDRLKMLGNLLRSLFAPALIALLVGAVWMDMPRAFLLGLAAVYVDALLNPAQASAWRRATLQLALLPATAAKLMDAILRALWRLFVSRRHLMDWVPAADASGSGDGLRIPGRATALLLLPGMLRPFWIPAALALAMLFWVGVDWAEDLSRKPVEEDAELRPEQLSMLRELATETWRFFESFVPADGAGLPPDNVQFDPPAGAAPRTSPTNIGLYLMSCLSARELGLLSGEEMLSRMRRCADTLEGLEKWNGQLYNWYDTESLAPLKPRYVSAVDSGNLAAALLLCAQCVAGEDEGLYSRLDALARGMRLDMLYDGERDLFFIGADVESGRISEAHYDLYASEARILSYAAMMLGQAPVKHWQRLSRPVVRAGKAQALLSWSGTMFEYLMPELLLGSCGDSLAGRSKNAVVEAQMDFAGKRNRPWGVSESGYYAFDLHLAYQYRAFGLRELALSGSAAADVVSPYASALALCCRPVAAAENIARMRRLGWHNEYGMYEAADYQNSGEPRLVKSCMAHHQGMVLCAICNAMKGKLLSRRFMEIPEARALRLLLQEKPFGRMKMPSRRERPLLGREPARPERSWRRMAGGDRIADTHLLSGGGTSALVTARGAVFARRNHMLLNRFSGDLLNRHEGMFVHLEDLEGGEKSLFGASGRAEFDAGIACFEEKIGKVNARLAVFISPEDGALYQRVELENSGEEEKRIAVTGCMAVALANEGDMRAHPTFQNLFIESRRAGNGLIFHRRQRERGAAAPDMIYSCSGEAEWESDLEALVCRAGSLGMPGGLAGKFTGASGAVLNPCAALRRTVRVPAGERVKLHFALAVGQNCEARAAQLEDAASAERACQLAAAHARAALRHAAVEPPAHRLLQRAAAFLVDAKIGAAQERGSREAAGRERLWSCGISGDLPILLLEVKENARIDCVRELAHAHAFYRMMGVETDFVIIDGEQGGYQRPLRDALDGLISASHLHALRNLPGGVFILDGQKLDPRSADALRRAAALRFEGDRSAARQLRIRLECLNLNRREEWLPMEPVNRAPQDYLEFFNGYGGFDGEAYVICLSRDTLPPAPWSNIIATETAGAVLTDRGGGFAWRKNSRSGRLTPFRNDMLREGWGWMFYLTDARKRRWTRILPGDVPMTDYTVRFSPGLCRWEAAAGEAAFCVEARAAEDGIRFEITVENRGRAENEWTLAGAVDWLLGVDALDARMISAWTKYGACFAAGASGVGCFAADDPLAQAGCGRNALLGSGDINNPDGIGMPEESGSGWTLRLPLRLGPGEKKKTRFLLGGADTEEAAYALLRSFQAGEREAAGEDILRIHTPDAAVNCLANGFLQAQVKYARVLGRTGLYQPGGAYGFRDQLQDMLPLVYTEPERVRAHLLRCAAKQFEAGDVLHWWHEPAIGVRTNIRDDLLFLPFVAARYVLVTGDTAVLREEVPYLKDVGMPEGGEDIYAPMESSDVMESLHGHCMRAFRRCAETGRNGLCLMGSGDWNDGMNRVGADGRGESVWLTEFLAVCAADYARIAPDENDRAWLYALNERLCAAIESAGWDGGWYLRAYADDGRVLGGKASRNCSIDAISQAWAVLAGLDSGRCKSAMDAAWEQLADKDLRLIRLLAPAFDGEGFDPGYIAAYPPGIRENGAQYTHGACWLILALIRMGDGRRAHEAIRMLLPVNHARTREEADIYRVEPYVMAADVYTNPLHPGRGGWSWYTGSGAWMLMVIYELLGFERRGNRVRINALLGEWKQASIAVHFGSSRYELVCSRDAGEITLDGEPCAGYIEMVDDGRSHTAVFPPRREMKNNMADTGNPAAVCYNTQ